MPLWFRTGTCSHSTTSTCSTDQACLKPTSRSCNMAITALFCLLFISYGSFFKDTLMLTTNNHFSHTQTSSMQRDKSFSSLALLTFFTGYSLKRSGCTPFRTIIRKTKIWMTMGGHSLTIMTSSTIKIATLLSKTNMACSSTGSIGSSVLKKYQS